MSGITHVANPRALLGKPYPDHLRDIIRIENCRDARAAIRNWPSYRQSPLHSLDGLAGQCRVGRIFYKDESRRFGLKSFKALGGAYAVARQLQQIVARESGRKIEIDELFDDTYSEILRRVTVATATDGNHGRAVSWGADMFGCRCVIFIHSRVSAHREQAMARFGAEVRRVPGNYDDSVREAASAAAAHGWLLVSDTSYEGYTEIPRDVYAGYSVMLQEAAEQLEAEVPTHVLVQGGCGGLAGTVCGYLWELYGERNPRLIVVEPERANCLQESARAGRMTVVEGDLETLMAGLSCGEVSELAWPILEKGARDFITVPEHWVPRAMKLLAVGSGGDPPLEAGESAVAGIAALLAMQEDPALRRNLGLGPESRVLLFGTEGATDPELYQRLIA